MILCTLEFLTFISGYLLSGIMKLSEGVEWATHCCILLAMIPPDRSLTVARLAEFHEVPAPYLAKHLQQLSRSGILEAVSGPRGGYRLAQIPENIALLHIVESIDGPDPCFRCEEIRQRGPSKISAPYTKPCGIARAMWRAEKAWRDELSKVSIADILEGMQHDIHPQQEAKAQAWLEEVFS